MKTSEATAKKITEETADSAFEVVKDREFQTMTDFGNLEQTE